MESNSSIEINGTQSRSNQDDEISWRLQIMDQESHQLVVSVLIPARDVMALLGGTTVVMDGWLAKDELASRVGKKMEMHTMLIPREITSVPYGEAPAAAKSWAVKFAQDNGWDTGEAINTNTGWKAIFRLWV